MVKEKIVNSLKYLISAGIIATLLGIFIPFYLRAQVDLHATLVQPFPSPKDEGHIQALIIFNEGKAAAEEMITKVKYPRVIEPLDYVIQSMEKLNYQTRTDLELNFKVPRLTCGDYIIAVFAVENNEIKPSDIRLTHKTGTLESEKIEYVKLNNWRH